MKPVTQTRFGFPNGNCMQACAASILEVPLEHVIDPGITVDDPNAPDDEFWKVWNRWWWERGYRLVMLRGKGVEQRQVIVDGWSDQYVIVGGQSPRGKWGHAVVGRISLKGIEIVHDPHPSRKGLATIEDVTLFIPAAKGGGE